MLCPCYAHAMPMPPDRPPHRWRGATRWRCASLDGDDDDRRPRQSVGHACCACSTSERSSQQPPASVRSPPSSSWLHAEKSSSSIFGQRSASERSPICVSWSQRATRSSLSPVQWRATAQMPTSETSHRRTPHAGRRRSGSIHHETHRRAVVRARRRRGVVARDTPGNETNMRAREARHESKSRARANARTGERVNG